MSSVKSMETREVVRPKEGIYVFKRDEEERARLNSQHQALVGMIDGRIIHAPLDPKSIIRVADVGTGTGIWLEALAEYLKSFPTESGKKRQYDGFDLAETHFPLKHPGEFTYHVQNMLEPFPAEVRGTYDLVHVRLMVAALPVGAVEKAVKNLAELLKPGGWIQWDELDGETWGGRIQTPCVREMYELIKEHMAKRGMERHIPASFVEAAEKKDSQLENAQAIAFNTTQWGPAIREDINRAFLWSYERAARMVLQASAKEGIEQDGNRLSQGGEKEIKQEGFYWDSDFYVLLAQKKGI